MILIKGFLRKKSSKKYIILLSIILLAISAVFNISQYCSNIITNTYQKNSYFFGISEKNFFNDLIANKYVTNVKKVVLLESNNVSFVNNDINKSILIDQGNEFIIIIQDEKNEINNEQVILELPKFELNNVSELSDLIGKEIGLKNEKFEILKINGSNFARVIVSCDFFEELKSNDDYFAYIFNLNEYGKKEEIIDYLNAHGININFIQFYESEAEFNTIDALEKTNDFLKRGSIAVIAIFLILFVIIANNIVSDEIDRMNIERLIGYNKLQIRKILILKMIVLNALVIFFYSILYVILNILIYAFFNINLNMWSVYLIFIILILFITTIILCCFKSIKRYIYK